MVLRIKGKGAVFQDVPVTAALSQALNEWQNYQEHFKGRKIFGRLGVDFAASPSAIWLASRRTVFRAARLAPCRPVAHGRDG